MFKVKYVDSIMMLVRLDLNLIVSLFQHKCEVSKKVSTTTLDIISCSNLGFRKEVHLSMAQRNNNKLKTFTQVGCLM